MNTSAPTHEMTISNRSLARQVSLRVVLVTAVLSAAFVAVFVEVATRLIAANAREEIAILVENVRPFAEMAAYSTSRYSAEAALKLLKGNPSVARASITDNFGEELARFENPAIAREPQGKTESLKFALHLAAGKEVYGHLAIDLIYRPSTLARFFLYAGVGAILLTGLLLAYLLHAVFRRNVLTPLTRLERELAKWPLTGDTRPPEIDFNSRELNQLARAFAETLHRGVVATEDRNHAWAQRALIADAVDSALARSGIFLVATGEGGKAPGMTFGAPIPAPIAQIVSSLTTGGSDARAVVRSKIWDADVSIARRNVSSKKDTPDDVIIIEMTLPDERVWNVTCVALDPMRRSVVGAETTALKRLSLQAEAARRLEAIGVLASGVAHDFNNVLAVITSSLTLYGRSVDAMPEALKAALRAAERGSQVTRQLLDASRSEASSYGAVDLAVLITGMEAQLHNLLGSKHPLNVRLATTNGAIADAAQLETTLINLVMNARDSSPPGYAIDVLVRDADEEEVREHDLPPERKYILFRVSDHGTGIAKDALPRIFEPFYSTKRQGQGTGLGLSLARSFALRSQGKIWATSEPENGTRFSLLLPSCDLADTREQWRAASPPARGERRLEGRRILVVEDEADLLSTILTYFSLEGCEAVGAATLNEARTLIEANEAQPFDFVLTDIVLPDGLGIALLDRAASGQLRSKVLLMGGNFDERSLSPAQKAAMTAMYKKPFSMDDVIQTICKASRQQAQRN